MKAVGSSVLLVTASFLAFTVFCSDDGECNRVWALVALCCNVSLFLCLYEKVTANSTGSYSGSNRDRNYRGHFAEDFTAIEITELYHQISKRLPCDALLTQTGPVSVNSYLSFAIPSHAVTSFTPLRLCLLYLSIYLSLLIGIYLSLATLGPLSIMSSF